MVSLSLSTLRKAIDQAYLNDETASVIELMVGLTDYNPAEAEALARLLVEQIRADKDKQSVVDAFMHEYRLNSEEGVVLMSIAEALLRIPDSATQDRFLADKLSSADWQTHLHHSDSMLVNLSTGALLVTGLFERYIKADEAQVFEYLLGRLGQPVIRLALQKAMHFLGSQFVMAETIFEALHASQKYSEYRYSFDMLGEAAVTASDAERYFSAYLDAIRQLSQESDGESLFEKPGVSVKLSALCPRYEALQHQRATPELTAKLLTLAQYARQGGLTLTVDAEESERLSLSLTIFEAVFTHPSLKGWPGLGLAVQAYQKRAPHVIAWLSALAKTEHKKIPVRLVKGAYWDTEIKRDQEQGLTGYPVFTRKSATDISYLACATRLLIEPDIFYPQFATHNAHTVAAIRQMAGNRKDYEFQRLHGMGEALYQNLATHPNWSIPCRIYAPIGHYQELLPYLVRRLLENGANTSFVNQIENPDIDIERIVQNPVSFWLGLNDFEKTSVPLPVDLFGKERRNSEGFNLADTEQLYSLQKSLDELSGLSHHAGPLINGKCLSGSERVIVNPANHSHKVGTVAFCGADTVADALDTASKAFDAWRSTNVQKRARYLNNAADLLEYNRTELVSLCVSEGGRTIKDALADVREAVDFCRYYAARALELFDRPMALPGPCGEDNFLTYYGRGVFLCISPWNFPIAIFTGQIAAALAAGNTVVAKPAEATSLTAAACVKLLHQAGIPGPVLNFVPGIGSEIGPLLLRDPRIAGVAFTGSTETARSINRQLAEHADIVPLIAETGGQNAMIADTSAHKEQLVLDAVQSAFNSAGQRCSALRVLFLPHETADKIIELLIGAMQQLTIGDPGHYATDIGPVIDRKALDKLNAHVEAMRQHAGILFQSPLPPELPDGTYFPPTLIEIDSLAQLTEEVFGPILHIVRYSSNTLEQVIDDINATGYGLTLGIHSRINATARKIQQQAKVGNLYINRNMIGATVGVQPFGGMGLSGTGPKAGGPDYLKRFAVEQTVTINTAAIGGNASLLNQDLR
ncbi:bifunctional proline dehydrogenase/L-glutamate gamma-semialdehyde dehydrogenase PutA [Methylotuvimicrobium alcaliphilum]|uniref:Bifunctional protein PutA n=1 Tax=Methylotuvimicrobium alcaliphilum (strain DSM 19304 / NCIMB 14124 / VKM B-2133 / 20Z) TaxID=1091494 RepID=G4T0X9_META2|nr:bifunctional proline dehydrogenase/L-glutamate gamma-semialdehyde dehydrogenase PutA [Methylotuvimicrobium alcaliphilum]CCE23413.1 Delta-1-pyrroline-5-carboxylate dehydrogenase [Methylotuvimicrobium alcaliphilum 20Z]